MSTRYVIFFYPYSSTCLCFVLKGVSHRGIFWNEKQHLKNKKRSFIFIYIFTIYWLSLFLCVTNFLPGVIFLLLVKLPLAVLLMQMYWQWILSGFVCLMMYFNFEKYFQCIINLSWPGCFYLCFHVCHETALNLLSSSRFKSFIFITKFHCDMTWVWFSSCFSCWSLLNF